MVDYLIDGIPSEQLKTQAKMHSFSSVEEIIKAFSGIKLKMDPVTKKESQWDKRKSEPKRSTDQDKTRKSPTPSRGGLSFDSPNLTHGPAGLSFRPVRDLTSEDIWRLVSSVAQSAGGLDIAEIFDVSVFNVAAPAGRGGRANRLTREDVAKRSILQLNNSDNLCFPRFLVVARAHCERGNLRMGELHEKWNCIRRRLQYTE
ncbi:hypothetical protein ALC57_03024 [Trachymyrmex cornetzi]|uniref:Uncharacterized protein n=1 Tax=Trachymyrmex cornetzi TaxID=471704 RepID=A0A151JMQ6_9HYME|nr:hypothetical protein ALC57_03024 [Trachymyrmex cornetzi]